LKITEFNPYALMDRFPTHREIIKHLFRKDKTFQTLCSDYQRCCKALDHWNKSDLREASQRREEYDALLLELESEILVILNNFNISYKDEAHKH
jgi:hypothetical protein